MCWVPNILPDPLCLEPANQKKWHPRLVKLILLGKETYKLDKKWPIRVDDFRDFPLSKQIKLNGMTVKSFDFHSAG